MDIASPNTEEVTTARWFVMRAYKSEKRAEEKLKGKDGLEYFIPKCYAVRVYHGVKSKRLVLPDDQMESFIKVSSQYGENISYYNPDELDLRKGCRVRIHGGKLNGVTGVFMQVQGKRNRRVVVLLEGVMAVAAEVHPDLIEVIS